MARICSQCGWEYTLNSDFEPGTGRCWECAAKAYKKGLDRIKERARLGAQVLIEEIGASGPEDVDKTAERAADVIRDLRAKVTTRDWLVREWLQASPLQNMDEAIMVQELEERSKAALKESEEGIRHSCVDRKVPGEDMPTAVWLCDGTKIRVVSNSSAAWLEHLPLDILRTQDDEADR